VRSVAENVPVPLARVESAGRVPAESVPVKCTMPGKAGSRFPNGSRAVSVNGKGVPGVAVAGTVKTRWVAATGPTTIVVEVPVIDGLTVSVAVRVLVPAVFSVAVKDLIPFVSVESAGRVAELSELVKWASPVYPVAVLPNGSRAVTVKPNEVPAVAVAGTVRRKCVAIPGVTRIALDVPVVAGTRVSVAVMVWDPVVLSITEKTPTPPVSVESAGKVAAPSVDVR
jgi:hypothetical protein